ncbi:MAG TPA: hypothetical protein GX708_18365 [Gallicola sp.]|nr:hypothetical protein [Gallicola sp.]
MKRELEGCQYGICCNNDKYQTLQKELSKTKKENEILTKNAEHNDKVVDKVNWENMFLKDKLKKIEEYITSYESISTIQGLNDTKENKNLDKNTMVEMTNRYLKVHDKILSIIKGDDIMCYTGKCNYEDYVGECTLNCKPGEYPNDAHCLEQDLLIDEEELLNNYYKQINQYNQNKQEEINDDTFDFDDFNLDEEEI